MIEIGADEAKSVPSAGYNTDNTDNTDNTIDELDSLGLQRAYGTSL